MNKTFQEIFSILEKEHEKEKNLRLNSRILIIDALNNFIRIWVTMPTTNDDGQHVGGIVGFLYTLGVAIRTLRPTRVFIVLDGKNSSSRRKKIFPKYKENRGAGTRLNRAYKWEDEDDERKQMQYQMLRIVKYLKNLPVTFIMIDNIEADDSIACLADLYRQREDLQELFIVSSDKDFYQLIDERIKVWNPIKKQMINEEEFVKIYNMQPYNFALLKSLLGDKSDNIPGIKGLGPKTIQKHYEFLNEHKKYIPDDIIRYAESHLEGGRAFQLLFDHKEQYLMNYRLMKLTNHNIPNSAVLKIVGAVNNKVPEINLINIQELVKQDKLWNSFKNINEWVLSNFLVLNSFVKNI
jgi:5'-3' exonuclease